ncbi:uncharacterized protein LOC110884521 isoform X1 [Helianthus annuus]|uniref:uncharacterized protein LOC110884521 isoform X1 n=1 Tax=Helianthus annuus TaxID=4232 RepID=UPI000B8FC833|nr:uncharacterized protein LOC110884521 isoform X1 [Helianthus annuus]XP_021987928.1 uncharacterized protein LOC110884521 isoform X1 [Helianthus annuus]XP_021987929.1 uncharacterized protein LOC110884521 isoform X1 [Helianthus annuus]XP_021987930.1 uncharacterized protein LOC110884521 isoform X1 [Helianthus annuus]XP_035834455.1 uncharacterized protein LOC110884521 isoform X1 [Helianthus annuus]XP_035834456.1 uncharacterized protein LOC110884521 isoform X1 [Helianthus annuus]
MEFSKPSKPRVWYTRPWSPSASVKPLSHSGCRENRTNKHSYHLKVNFAELGSNTLGRYSTFELYRPRLCENIWRDQNNADVEGGFVERTPQELYTPNVVGCGLHQQTLYFLCTCVSGT